MHVDVLYPLHVNVEYGTRIPFCWALLEPYDLVDFECGDNFESFRTDEKSRNIVQRCKDAFFGAETFMKKCFKIVNTHDSETATVWCFWEQSVK